MYTIIDPSSFIQRFLINTICGHAEHEQCGLRCRVRLIHLSYLDISYCGHFIHPSVCFYMDKRRNWEIRMILPFKYWVIQDRIHFGSNCANRDKSRATHFFEISTRKLKVLEGCYLNSQKTIRSKFIDLHPLGTISCTILHFSMY